MVHTFEQDKVENICYLAKNYGWHLDIDDKHSCMLSFLKDKVRLNVWWTKMTVSTALKHPVKGKTQLFRKGVSMKLLEELFINPRKHTNKGYAKKTNRNARRWL